MPGDDLACPNHESLLPWQPDNIRNVLKVWRDGSLAGHGNDERPAARSAMGMGKCAISIIAASTAGFERVLVIAPKAAIPKPRYAIRQLMKQFEITKMEILRVAT
jgi:hypothetical protein